MSKTNEPIESRFQAASNSETSAPVEFVCPFRCSLRGMLIYVAVACVVLTIVIKIVTEIHRVQQGIADHYALTEVIEMISHYHRTHEGAFPSRWEDMRADYTFVDQGYSLGPGGFEQLQRQVSINFGLLSDKAKFTLLDGKSDRSQDFWFIRLRNERKSEVLMTAERRANERIERLWRRGAPEN